METTFFAHEMDNTPQGRDTTLWGFYPSLFVSRMTHGNDRVYYKVSVTPFEGPEENASYWAWWSKGGVTGDKVGFCHVYYSKLMVQMCFPYDLAIYEEKGEGKQMPVNVDIIEAIFPNERHDNVQE